MRLVVVCFKSKEMRVGVGGIPRSGSCWTVSAEFHSSMIPDSYTNVNKVFGFLKGWPPAEDFGN